jgi:hypothetical protein
VIRPDWKHRNLDPLAPGAERQTSSWWRRSPTRWSPERPPGSSPRAVVRAELALAIPRELTIDANVEVIIVRATRSRDRRA